MYQKLLAYFAPNKYRLMMFFLLAGATIFSVVIWRVRTEFSGTGRYGFLIWNLFLAWIPFIIAYFTYTLTLNRKWIYFVIPLAAFLWLIFFPNAPYILTDFQHLAYPANDLPVWYDVMMLIWFAFTGLLLGMVSLFLMQEIIRREFGRWVGWTFVALVTSLTSAGVYVGRFLRWNSWDILQNPIGLAAYTFERVQNPSLQAIGFTSLFAAFFLFLYITLYTFGHLLLERPANQMKSR
jgi:Predicted membrane protein